MIQFIVRFILGLYPPWWKRRYGAENADLTEQLLEEPDAHRWRVVASLLSGSMLAWLQVRRVGDYLNPLSSPNQWGMVPRGSHRDIFGNRGLWPRSEAELEPDEVLLGVIDGVVGNRFVAFMPMEGVIFVVLPLIMSLHFRPFSWNMPVVGAILLALGLLLRPLTKSYYVSVAVTSHGVVVFRRGITGRTGKMIERMPAVEPEFLKLGIMTQVRLGDRRLRLNAGSDPLLYWMSQSLRSAGRR
ncbi:MAG: hypothetical protein ACLPR9_07095 [Acidimicrobiales bacterium]|jgi:hypothetical protein